MNPWAELARLAREAVAPTRPCRVLVSGDMCRCVICDLVWDTNDPDPPRCEHRSDP